MWGNGWESEVVSGISVLVKKPLSWPFPELKEAGEKRHRAARSP